jgi:septal ring factor EnvC (AmiA/AmiB activator)
MHDDLKSIEVASLNIKDCEADKSSEESVDKATQKVVELESELASNSKIIKDLKENEANLEVENKMNKEQVEKLMRVASNMHKELAELKTSSS